MAAGAAFPPLHAAGLHAGLGELPCDVRQGGLRDAILHSAGANAAHGLRRTNADKRRAVLMLLEDGEWSQWSDREIGRQCLVDHKTVTRLREEHLGKSPDAPRTVSRGGKVYSMDTGRIGRPRSMPSPPLDAPPSNVLLTMMADPCRSSEAARILWQLHPGQRRRSCRDTLCRSD